jgi:glycolate oxidase FAD binding subunit
MTQALIATEILTNDTFVQALQQSISSGSGSPLVPVGGRTKTGFFQANKANLIDMREYQGIVTYDPSEYLITAKAGTPIADLRQALAGHGQYLPFDPMWSDRGATLGGTIASGVSGPDRLLYGGVRDFVMEVAMVDGLGRIVRGGGKVVKNAAGFDTPKMMVGSYGRMGVLVEATLKVFPAPQAYATVVISHSSIELAIRTMQRVLAKSLPISSVLIDSQHQLCIRIAGPTLSLNGVIDRLQALLPDRSSATVDLDDSLQRRRFVDWIESDLGPGHVLARIGVSPREIAPLEAVLTDCERFHLGACSVTWAKIALNQVQGIHEKLSQFGLSAVIVSGQFNQPFLGNRNWLSMAERIQHAIDPNHRFLPWH